MKFGAFLMMGAGLAGVCAALCLMGGSAAMAQSGGVMAVQQGPNTQSYDIPPGSKDQTVIITTREFQPGETVGAHMHHGVEMAQVVRGSFEVFIKGQPQGLQPGGLGVGGGALLLHLVADHLGAPVGGVLPGFRVGYRLLLVSHAPSYPREADTASLAARKVNRHPAAIRLGGKI